MSGGICYRVGLNMTEKSGLTRENRGVGFPVKTLIPKSLIDSGEMGISGD